MKKCKKLKEKKRPYLNSTRYDSNARLIYKETVEADEEKYIHHMSYDNDGRCIYYQKIKASTNKILREEYTIYSNTQTPFNVIYNYEAGVVMVRTGFNESSISKNNPNGFIHKKVFNSNTGDVIINIYNSSNGKYDSTVIHSPFKFILNKLEVK